MSGEIFISVFGSDFHGAEEAESPAARCEVTGEPSHPKPGRLLSASSSSPPRRRVSSGGDGEESDAFAIRQEGIALLCRPEHRQAGLKKLLAAAQLYLQIAQSVGSENERNEEGEKTAKLQRASGCALEPSQVAALLQTADIFSLIGEALHEDGEIEGALKYFTKAAGIVAGNAPESLLLAEMLESVGNCSLQLGLLEDATAKFRKSCEIVKAKFGENSAAEANLLDKLAVSLQSQHRFVEAENNALASLSIKKKLHSPRVEAENSPGSSPFGPSDTHWLGPIEVAAGYSSVGSIFYAQHKLMEARDAFSRALDILDSCCPELALSQAGDVLFLPGQSSTLMVCDGRQEPAGFTTSDTVMLEACKVLTSLGDVHDSLDEPLKAIRFYKQAVAICEVSGACFTSKEEIHRDACANIAELYRLLGLLHDADAFARRTCL
jgi:tetratricopeptide (TPR) repeat protein